MNCRRCDYRGDNLTEHAVEAEHPLCAVCERESLTDYERQTCAKCVGRIRADLADIENLYARLPGLLVETRFSGNTSADKIPSGDDDERLLGGEPLAMLARGGTGMDTARRLPTHTHETAPVDYPEIPGSDDTKPTLPAWRREAVLTDGREHAADERLTDPSSIADFLAILEDDWRNLQHHQAAGPPSVSGSVAYLTSQLDRMAQAHSEFDYFAKDIRDLVTRLRSVTGTENYPMRGVECFDCGTRLERRYLDPERQADGSRLGGLEDEWGCPKCHRSYEPAEYWLALRAALERETA